MTYEPASRPPRPRPCAERSVGASFVEVSSASNRNRNRQIDKQMKQYRVGELCVCGFRPIRDACRRLATFVSLSVRLCVCVQL